MIPLRDENPTTRPPIVTVSLIVACVLIFLWQVSLGPYGQRPVISFGAIPALLLDDRILPPELYRIPAELTLVTSLFLHGGWMHLIGNMLFLWVFGNNIEDAFGHVRFIAFYLLCGILAGLAHALQDPSSQVPLIGASGAISGVLGAYALLYPNARVLTLVPFIIFFVVRLRAVVVIGLWFVFQLLNAVLDSGAGGIAYLAHIGGFVAGVALLYVFKPRAAPKSIRRRGPWG